MKILVDICHPAHVHFFRRPIEIWRSRGHDIVVTSREKEMATDLLDGMHVQHQVLSRQASGSPLSLLRELAIRNQRLSGIVRRERPNVLTAIGGIFVAQVGWLLRVPSIVFYDTENARLQNALTYPFVSKLCVPNCYKGWTPKRRTDRYPGYHELSYLHPSSFRPNRHIAMANGLDPARATFLVRLVSWKANHDIGARGWSEELLRRTVASLTEHGRVLISSEAKLPSDLAAYQYRGDPRAIHHVMAFSRGYVGESATMASECAVLGVPAVYAASIGRGYTDELERRFGLVRNVHCLDIQSMQAAIHWLTSREPTSCSHARTQLLKETIDVAPFVADMVERLAERRRRA